jgi:phosphohistidine phosphatase SixA
VRLCDLAPLQQKNKIMPKKTTPLAHFLIFFASLILLTACRQTTPPPVPTATLPAVVTFQAATAAPPTPTQPSPAATTEPETLLTGPTLLEALQQGGYVIFFRHGATHKAQLDTDQQNLENCATQRNLNEEGEAQAELIGDAFQAAQIPLGPIQASPYCRTRHTAELAFGRVELTDELINPFASEDEAEVARLGQQLAHLLSVPPPAGQNTVLVGHTPNLLAATGLSLVEGEAAIFRPAGAGGFTLVGRVLAEEWASLAQ